ncbi:MAG: YgcG family protein [Paracoccaceae bacterium]
MTRHDIRVAITLFAVVVAVGLGLGYLVGSMTRSTPYDGNVAGGTHGGFAGQQRDGLPNLNTGELPWWGDLYVNDYGDLLSPTAERRIRRTLTDLYDQTGIEATVLTIPSIDAYGTHEEIEPFATALFNHWGVGEALRNNGVMIIVSEWDRRMRIEIGRGYHTGWNDRMQRVIDVGFLPFFRNEEYEQGILNGVDETIYELTGSYPGQEDASTVQRGWDQIWRAVKRSGGWLLLVLVVPAGAFALWLRRYFRNRPRPCPSCKTMMIRAGEEADDEHLDGGQRLEEYLKSVDYDVWHCPSCGDMQILRYASMSSGFGACPQCSYKTMRSQSTVEVPASRTTSGTKKVEYSCENCDYTKTEYRTIPKITSSSSSSGSSRSSFGGGSSSGGGASGSW